MVFEKAVYSDEDIVRSDYEKFYVFARELGKTAQFKSLEGLNAGRKQIEGGFAVK